MSVRNDVAAGFSISGLLDSSSKTRNRFPVVEIGWTSSRTIPQTPPTPWTKPASACLQNPYSTTGSPICRWFSNSPMAHGK